jgi:hypothetical protein
VEHFATKMVSSGYCYGIDTWQTLPTAMTFLTCIYPLYWFVVEKKHFPIAKNNLQLFL